MDMNGHQQAFAQMQAMQQFEQFVHAACNQALSMLAPGYKPTVIFSHATDRRQDIIITAANLPDVLGALVAKMQAAGVPMPANLVQQAPAAANDAQSPDLHLAVINVVSAIRRSLPFITGPGADTARKMLLDAIKADGVSETARQVVAGFLSSVPGNTDAHPGDIDKMLAQAIDGAGEAALVFYSNPELGRHQ